MDPVQRLVSLYYIAAVATLTWGFVLCHMIMLRSWVHWWADVKALFREEIRRMIREELERRSHDPTDP